MPIGMMSIMYPQAKIKKIGTIKSACFSIISLIIVEVSVATDAAAATVEFLSKAINVLPNGATEPQKVCGRITCVADWKKFNPRARQASAWPTGTVLRPDLNDSQTNAAV